MAINIELFEDLMKEALIEAEKARAINEVPVGAIVYYGGEIIARAHNLTECSPDPTAHAEILALRKAAHALGDWRMANTTLVVTMEPCTMCIGALRLARVPTIVFGAFDERAGAAGSLFDISCDPRLGQLPRVIGGVREKECVKVLRDFFSEKRKQTPQGLVC